MRKHPPKGSLEYIKLPAQGQRCPITNASRSWLIAANRRAGENAFLFKTAHVGKRGSAFINVTKLRRFMAGEENAWHHDHDQPVKRKDTQK